MTVARQPYVWCEPFAGSAALTCWLLGGKPPISYCGSKQGYAPVIADILGLSQHHKPAGIVLCEPGPFAAVHATLGGASGSAEDVASWLLSIRWSFSEKGPDHGYGGPGCPVKTDKAQWTTEDRDKALSIDRFGELLDNGPLPNAKQVANIIRSWKDEEPRALWNRLKAKGWPSLLLPEGCRGRWLGPQSVQDVAGWLWVGGHENMHGSNLAPQYMEGWKERKAADSRAWGTEPTTWLIDRVESLPTFPALAVYQGFAEDLMLPADLSGCYVLMDPPYKGDLTGKITGYKHGDCSRETVLNLARDYSRRGAVVAICESVRLDADLGDGWTAVEISHARKGQVRSFTRNQGSNKKEPQEWVTLNRPPQYVPPKQVGLFA